MRQKLEAILSILKNYWIKKVFQILQKKQNQNISMKSNKTFGKTTLRKKEFTKTS